MENPDLEGVEGGVNYLDATSHSLKAVKFAAQDIKQGTNVITALKSIPGNMKFGWQAATR